MVTKTLEHEGLALRQYRWLARSKPILLLLTAWGLSYAGDLAAFTAASVYAYRAGGTGLVAVLGLLKALPGAFLARAFVERMPIHIHTAILDAAVIAGGGVMIFEAARHLSW